MDGPGILPLLTAELIDLKPIHLYSFDSCVDHWLLAVIDSDGAHI